MLAGPESKTWPVYRVTTDIAYLADAAAVGERLVQRFNATPGVVIVSFSPADTGLPGFGGELALTYRSNLGDPKARQVGADLAAAAGLEVASALRIAGDLVEQVALPTIQTAGGKVGAAVGDTLSEAQGVVRGVATGVRWLPLALGAAGVLVGLKLLASLVKR